MESSDDHQVTADMYFRCDRFSRPRLDQLLAFFLRLLAQLFFLCIRQEAVDEFALALFIFLLGDEGLDDDTPSPFTRPS